MAQAEDPDIDNPEPGPGVECPFRYVILQKPE